MPDGRAQVGYEILTRGQRSLPKRNLMCRQIASEARYNTLSLAGLDGGGYEPFSAGREHILIDESVEHTEPMRTL